jgi:hypothetical protein
MQDPNSEFGITRWDKWKKVVGVLVSLWSASCGTSIGPYMVPRDRIEYVDAIGYSWEQQTLLNLVKLRYGHAPIFLSITQVVTGYQIQNTVSGGFFASNFSGLPNMLALSGMAAAQGQYTDRPTVIYAPLTGVDFLQKLMTPIPPATVLFLLQSGYDADIVMPLTLDSINGINNGSESGMRQEADPEFIRVVQLIRDLQLTRGIQARIEHPKKGEETSLITFPSSKNPRAIAARAEVRRILGLSQTAEQFKVYYGGYSGKGDEIAMMTRSMFQVMLELAANIQIPKPDVAKGKVSPTQVEAQAGERQLGPSVNIESGSEAPSNASVAVEFDHRWFWIDDTDYRSKAVFGSVMLLFSISDVGVKGTGPIVTIPAQG